VPVVDLEENVPSESASCKSRNLDNSLGTGKFGHRDMLGHMDITWVQMLKDVIGSF